MGSLSNLYISQSFQSLLHFGNDSSASATLIQIQDGVGTNLGIHLNASGSISASNTITTNDLVVNNSTQLIGVFDLDTYFTASTPSYINSTQPFFTDTVFVTGSYLSGNYPPSIADVGVGWIGNGINVTNGIVTAVSESVSGYYITMAGEFPQIAQSYTFTGQISPTAKITGSLEVSENLIVSGTFDIEGRVVVNDNVRINGDLEVSGSQRNTGSLFVSNEISSSTINGIGNVTQYSQSVNARLVIVEATASLFVPFSQSVDSRLDFLEVPFSTSVDARLDIVEATASLFVPFSTSVNSRLVDLENFSSSTYNTFSASVEQQFNSLENATASLFTSTSLSLTTASFDTGSRNLTLVKGNNDTFNLFIPGTLAPAGTVSSSAQILIYDTDGFANFNDSLQADIGQRLFTSSFNTYTSSVDSDLAAIKQTTSSLNTSTASLNISTASLNSFTESANTRLNTLSSFTASYATTGSNFFIGNQTFSGSVEGSVVDLTISSQTASMNLLSANFFTLTLVAATNTHISAFNATDGQTISLKVTQPVGGFGTVSFSPNVRFPQSFPYIATPSGSAVDIISFQTYDPSFIYGVAVNTMR